MSRSSTAEPSGERFPVEVPTHVTGVIDFVAGPVGTIAMSFDVWRHNLPRIEIYGSEGALSVPDPNQFGGPVRLCRAGADEWQEIPLTHTADTGRGIGVADMASGLLAGRPHRASGQLAYHILDVMQAFEESSTSRQHIEIGSAASTARPAPLPHGLAPGRLDP